MNRLSKAVNVGLGSALVYALPLVAAAQSGGAVGVFLGSVYRWVTILVTILLILAVVVFFWGLIKYLTAVGEEKHKGLMIMFYGILTIFVMVALWGLVAFMQSTFGIQAAGAPTFDVPNSQLQ